MKFYYQIQIMNKLYLYLKTWYQETPDIYYNELKGTFDNYVDLCDYLKNNIEDLSNNLPIVEIIISETEKIDYEKFR